MLIGLERTKSKFDVLINSTADDKATKGKRGFKPLILFDNSTPFISGIQISNKPSSKSYLLADMYLRASLPDAHIIGFIFNSNNISLKITLLSESSSTTNMYLFSSNLESLFNSSSISFIGKCLQVK